MIDRRKHIWSLLAAILLILTSSAWGKTITVVLRYDDYSSQSPTGFESRLIDALRRTNSRATFAVIPNASTRMYDRGAELRYVPLQPEKGGLLREGVADGVISIAQHGFTHEVVADHGEFNGLGYREQLGRIRRGKQMLESVAGIPVTTFVPPGNAYDDNTLRVLRQLRFKCISACQFGDSEAGGELSFLPEMANIRRLRAYVDMARRSQAERPMIVVMLHPQDFTDVDRKSGVVSLAELESDLRWLDSQPDVRTATLDQVIQDTPGLDVGTFRANEVYQHEMKIYPPVFARAPYGVYFQQGMARRERLNFGAVSGTFYLILALISGVSARRAARALWVTGSGRFITYVGVMLSLVVLVRALTRENLEWKNLIVASVVLGIWMGVMVTDKKRKRNRLRVPHKS